MKIYPFIILSLLCGCVADRQPFATEFEYKPIQTDSYAIATWQKINNPKNNQIHIYIEGDGYAYNAYGRPTSDPTPHGDFMRNLAMQDGFENVAYLARPCQFIMDNNCKQSDWTTGRFAQKIIDAETNAIKQIAGNKKITVIGYSGGAMVSGLIIKQHPNMNFEKWITVAGVLNHKDWTEYFGDAPLNQSLNMESLPNISQKHFVGGKDNVVPYELSQRWTKDIILISNATHNDFGKINLFD